MSYRIEYRSKGEVVMAVPCPKSLDEAKQDAYIGIHKFKADCARILDMDQDGVAVALISLDA